MSGRFVRASKFRHVHGDTPKKNGCFLGLKPYTNGESNYACASRNFLAVLKNGGGGPVYVFKQDSPDRFALNTPVVNVHKSKVLDVNFSPFNETMLATASDDGYAKVTLIPADGLTEDIKEAAVTLQGHNKKVMWVNWNPVASNVLMTASFDHTVKLWDIEAQAEVLSFNENSELIQSCVWNRNGSMAGTTSKDRQIRLFDPRAPDDFQSTDGHEGSKSQRIVFADDKNMIFGTGFSKTSMRKIGAWDLRNLGDMMYEVEIDQSAGVLIPHYDPDTGILYVGGKGDGTVRYYEIDTAEESDLANPICYLADFRSSDPHKAVCFAPKSAVDPMTCEIQRAYRVMKDYIEPLHFVVPRKSDLFQDDLYPETYAGVAMLDCAEWLDGANADPATAEILSLVEAGVEEAEFVAKKSPAELEKELADALARIAELEAQLGL